MKRLLSVCILMLLVCLAFNDAYSQAVDLKVVAMSPRLRSSGYPSFTAPAASTPNYVSTGLRTVGKGMKVYLQEWHERRYHKLAEALQNKSASLKSPTRPFGNAGNAVVWSRLSKRLLNARPVHTHKLFLSLYAENY